MLPKDRFGRAMLLLIAGLLAANLAVGFAFPAANAQAPAPQAIDYGNRGMFATAMATSADGKIVYVAARDKIFRSLDHGAPGSWELVVE